MDNASNFAFMERIAINLQFAESKLRLQSPPEDESFIRQASTVILERMKQHGSDTDDQEVLSRIVVESVVAFLKGIENSERTYRMVLDKATNLEEMIKV